VFLLNSISRPTESIKKYCLARGHDSTVDWLRT